MIKFIFIVSLISIEAIKNNKKKRLPFTAELSLCCVFLLKYFPPGSAPGSPAPQRLIQNASVTTQVYIDKKAEFTLQPKFLEVVRSLPNTDPKQTVFSYEEVILSVSSHHRINVFLSSRSRYSSQLIFSPIKKNASILETSSSPWWAEILSVRPSEWRLSTAVK